MADIISYTDIIQKKINKINKEIVDWKRKNERLRKDIELSKKAERAYDAQCKRKQFKIIK